MTMTIQSASIWLKLALLCLTLGSLVFAIGFSTVSWKTGKTRATFYTKRQSFTYGLWEWQACTGSECRSGDIDTRLLDHNDWKDFYRATQAMECLGLLCLGLAFLIMLVYACCETARRRGPLIAAILFSFAAVAFMVIGFAIFGTKMENMDVGWSMGMACGGCVLTFVGAVLAVIDLQK